MYYYAKNAPEQILPVNVTFNRFTAPKNQYIVAFMHHLHEGLEILAVKSGTLSVTLDKSEKYVLNHGDILIANPFTLHYGEVEAGKEVEYYAFSLQLSKIRVNNGMKHHTSLDDVMKNKLEFESYIGQNDEIITLFEQIHQLLKDNSLKSELEIISHTYKVLAILFKSSVKKAINVTGSKSTEFMTAVSIYLSENYYNDISTADIAAKLYCDTSYFCHKFRKHFGESFSNYLSMYRIIKSTELYKNSGLSIAEIAGRVGFSDYSYFSRSFKKHMGISPSKYFKKTN